MTGWLNEFVPTRSTPALWVEHLWLLGAKEAASAVRQLTLKPGLNVVWAREPADVAATGRKAAGHGVGKTSLCLLLRHALCDESDAINALRVEAHASFPEGGVAAIAHIGDSIWAVFRPFAAHRQAVAARLTDLELLLQSGTATLFDDYRAELSQTFIHSLPVSAVPGTGQPLEWRHVMAWCARDQGTRFEAYFRWRAGEGTGLRRVKQDPPLLVKAVLGILGVDAARLMADIEFAGQALEERARRVERLEREPLFNLNRAERALRRAVASSDAMAMEAPDLLTDGVMTMVESKLEQQVQSEQATDAEVARVDDQRQAVQQELRDVEGAISLLTFEKSRQQALHDGNQLEYERLSEEIATLRNRKGRCELGDVEFAECDHIRTRLVPIASIQRALDERAVLAAKAACSKASELLEVRLEPLRKEASLLTSKANALQASVRQLETRRATSALARGQLAAYRDEYRERVRNQMSGATSPEIAQLRIEERELNERRQSLLVKLESSRHIHASRVAQLSRMTMAFAERLLEPPATGWFDERSEDAPFRLAVGGEAFHVMEVLLGDLVCVMDAVCAESNRHPAFLIHDCPREADMGPHLYHAFLELVREVELAVERNGVASFQYLVTTTSAPPDALQREPYLRLTLRPDSEEDLLFRKQLREKTRELHA